MWKVQNFLSAFFLLLLVCAQVASFTPLQAKQRSKPTAKQKASQKKQEFFCGTASATWTVEADSQLLTNLDQGNISFGQAARKVLPAYPLKAVAARVEGEISVDVFVSTTGEVVTIQSVAGHSALAAASTDAAKQWKFSQSTANGEPIGVRARITFKYSLGSETPARKTQP